MSIPPGTDTENHPWGVPLLNGTAQYSCTDKYYLLFVSITGKRMIRQDYQLEQLNSEFLESPQISESLACDTTHNHLPQAQLTIICSSSSMKTNEVVVG